MRNLFALETLTPAIRIAGVDDAVLMTARPMHLMYPMNLFQGSIDMKKYFFENRGWILGKKGSSRFIGNGLELFFAKIGYLLSVWMNQMYIDELIANFTAKSHFLPFLTGEWMNLWRWQKYIHVHPSSTTTVFFVGNKL